jgi:hypothetical protein
MTITGWEFWGLKFSWLLTALMSIGFTISIWLTAHDSGGKYHLDQKRRESCPSRWLFDSPVTRKGRAGRATAPGVRRGLRSPKTSGSDGHAGACRSGAPGGAGASSGSSKNPMEAADLL